MPSVDFNHSPSSTQEYVTEKIHYANRASGFIKTNAEHSHMVAEAIKQIADDNYSCYASTAESSLYLRGIDFRLLVAGILAFAAIALVSEAVVGKKLLCQIKKKNAIRWCIMSSAYLVSSVITLPLTFLVSVAVGIRWSPIFSVLSGIFQLVFSAVAISLSIKGQALKRA